MLAYRVRWAGSELADPAAWLPAGRPATKEIAPALRAAGYRTAAPDQRGYSPGARPASILRYQIKHLVSDVLALADQAGVQRFHLVGHDWGSMVAWEVARRHPDRVASLTALSVGHPWATMAAARSGAQLAKSAYIFVFQVPWLVETWVRLYGMARGLRRVGLPEPFASRYGKRFGTMAALWGPLAWYRAFPLVTFDAAGRRAPREVRVPTTFVWGNQDAYVDRSTAERTGRYVYADSRFVELDADHWLPEAQPDALVPLILERVGA